ncbi:MAG: T9SS type A sorting domain-containing protein [Flavobacterium sp.]
MKKVIYCFILSVWGIASQAQGNRVTQGEYFWDTDPGEGSATAITAADGNFDSVLESILSTANVPTTPGLHVFGIRVKDNTGVWGPALKNVIHFGNTMTTNYAIVSQGEYFWDTDPGEGNATAVTAADGNFDTVLENIMQSTASVPATPGLHTFNIRMKDNTGVWGPVFKNVVVTGNPAIANYAIVTQAEYFWDTDPGEGNGMALPAADGTYDNMIENILKNDVGIVNPIGLHKINVRVKDNQGVWGPAFGNVIYIETTLAAEHFDLSALTVHPNPVKDMLTVSSEKEIATVSIYNLLGQGVIEKAVRATEGRIDVSNLATGTYIVKVAAGNKVKTLKIIKE